MQRWPGTWAVVFGSGIRGAGQGCHGQIHQLLVTKLLGSRGKGGWNSVLLFTSWASCSMEEEASLLVTQPGWLREASGQGCWVCGSPNQTPAWKERNLASLAHQLNSPAKTNWLIMEAWRAVQNSAEGAFIILGLKNYRYAGLQIPLWILHFIAS